MSEQKKKGKLSFFALDPKCDKYINWAVALLLLIGTFTIVSTNVGKTTYAPNIVPKVIVKQSIFCVCGYIAMWFMNRFFRFRWYSKIEWCIVPLCLFIMILPFAFPEIGGSHAWIQIAGISLQPSEFAKPLLLIICATCLYRAKKKSIMLKERVDSLKGRGPHLFVYVSLCFFKKIQEPLLSLDLSLYLVS